MHCCEINLNQEVFLVPHEIDHTDMTVKKRSIKHHHKHTTTKTSNSLGSKTINCPPTPPFTKKKKKEKKKKGEVGWQTYLLKSGFKVASFLIA